MRDFWEKHKGLVIVVGVVIIGLLVAIGTGVVHTPPHQDTAPAVQQ